MNKLAPGATSSAGSTFRAGGNQPPPSFPNLDFASVLPLLLSLIAALVLMPPGAVCAREQEPEVILPACGIRYPGGYDPNTVGVVEGRVARFALPGQGPVSFLLEAAGESYTVLAAPAWFWEERQIRIENGDRVRVKGSKTMGADGNLYLVAQEITVGDGEKPELLRDARGKPVWSGCGPGGCGKRGLR